MSYYNQLHPWCIIQCLPNAQTYIIARLRRRNDAEAHLQTLRQLTPSATYQLIFDWPQPPEHARTNPQPDSHRISLK